MSDWVTEYDPVQTVLDAVGRLEPTATGRQLREETRVSITCSESNATFPSFLEKKKKMKKNFTKKQVTKQKTLW
jgi:hypothetical protein